MQVGAITNLDEAGDHQLDVPRLQVNQRLFQGCRTGILRRVQLRLRIHGDGS
jgi:hypothetical protein